MQPLLALLPLLLFVVALVGARLSAASAGALSALLCLVLAITAFGYPLEPIALAGPIFDALFTTATILWIVFPALAIYEFQTRSGATDRLSEWLPSVSSKPQTTALLIGWFFAMLLEGAAGFGTPIALAAPMLVALGFPAVKALLIALVGHALGVSFGAVGTPIVPLLDAAPVDARELSLLILLPHALLGGALAFAVFRLARPEERERRASALWVALAAGLFLVPAAVLAWGTGPELPTLGGALIGGLLFGAIAAYAGGKASEHQHSALSLVRAVMPYGLVLLLILLTRLTPLAEGLRAIEWRWALSPAFGGAVAPLYHPGTMLFGALLLSAALAAPQERFVLGPALVGALGRLPKVALALVAVLMLARLMLHSGMIQALAAAAADALGARWAMAAPAVAAFGSFVTGSATASNIVLADLQVAAAERAGIAPLLALAGQGFGAAIGNIIAPHNIVAGAATVGLIGREGDVLRRTLPICLAYAAAGGLVLFVAGAYLTP